MELFAYLVLNSFNK